MTETTKRSKAPLVIVALLVLVAIAGYLGWRVYDAQQTPPAPVVEQPRVVDAGVPDAGPSLNPADGDVLLKDGAAGISGDAQLAKWLAQPDIVRRLVAAMMQISEGESPHETLGFIAVAGPFTVTEKGKGKKKQLFMSEKSMARYDPFTAIVGTINADAAGKLYAKVRPYAEGVFREIAPPGKDFDATLQKAVDHLAAVPIPSGPIALKPPTEGIGYVYADPALEQLTRAQKHLLRMGPKNAKVVVEQLKAFRAASAR